MEITAHRRVSRLPRLSDRAQLLPQAKRRGSSRPCTSHERRVHGHRRLLLLRVGSLIEEDVTELASCLPVSSHPALPVRLTVMADTKVRRFMLKNPDIGSVARDQQA